MSKRT